MESMEVWVLEKLTAGFEIVIEPVTTDPMYLPPSGVLVRLPDGSYIDIHGINKGWVYPAGAIKVKTNSR